MVALWVAQVGEWVVETPGGLLASWPRSVLRRLQGLTLDLPECLTCLTW